MKWSIGTATGFLDQSSVYKSTTTKPDLLMRMTHPTGGTKEVGYTLLRPQSATLNPNLAFPLPSGWQARQTAMGSGARETTLYTYEGGKMYLTGDVRDRRFAGFEKITKQDALRITNTYYHQGDTTSTTAGEMDETASSLLGKPYREDVLTDGSGARSRRPSITGMSPGPHHRYQRAPTNTHSIDLETSSRRQYLSIASGSTERA